MVWTVRKVDLSVRKIMLMAFVILLFSANLDYSQSNKESKKTVIEYQNDPTPLQKLIGDTSSIRKNKSDNTIMPGKIGEFYSPEQDSNYFRALKLKISPTNRFVLDLKKFESGWETEKAFASGSPLSQIAKNMMIPSSILAPTQEQVTMHQYNIMQSLAVPFVSTYNPMVGLKVPISTIGQFLGLVEDVSPVLSYKMDYSTDVEVVIYSMQAIVIATIFKGNQTPGSYKFTWNARDDRGRKVTSGDYIGEIRIGKERYIRKRIYIP